MNRLATTLLSVLSVLGASCGCNDIGCDTNVTVYVASERAVAQLVLTTHRGVATCPSQAGACGVEQLADGRTKFKFAAVPAASVQLRATNAMGATVFEGAVPLAITDVEVDENACEQSCKAGEATLP